VVASFWDCHSSKLYAKMGGGGVILWLSTLEDDGGFAVALEVQNRRYWSVVP